MWERFPFQKVWLSNIRQVPVPGVAIFLSFLSMACTAFFHVWFPSLHPLRFTLKSPTWRSFSFVVHRSHQKGKQQNHQKTRIRPLSFPYGGWEGLGILLSLMCFSTLAHEFTPCLSLLSASAFAQHGYKRREDTHAHAFSVAGGKACGYFHCCREWNTKTFQYSNLRVASWQQTLVMYP